MDTGRYAAKVQPPKPQLAAYSVADFARKHGLSAVRAKEILDRAGPSPEYADLLAERGKPAGSRDL